MVFVMEFNEEGEGEERSQQQSHSFMTSVLFVIENGIHFENQNLGGISIAQWYSMRLQW